MELSELSSLMCANAKGVVEEMGEILVSNLFASRMAIDTDLDVEKSTKFRELGT